MQQYLRKQIDWPQAFPDDEYAERRTRVRKALAAKNIDAIYITTPANLTYLTGYDMIWYHMRNLTGLLLRADNDQTVWFDGVGHKTLISTTPQINEVVWFQREKVANLVRQVVTELGSRGLGKARIALEPWGYSLRMARSLKRWSSGCAMAAQKWWTNRCWSSGSDSSNRRWKSPLSARRPQLPIVP